MWTEHVWKPVEKIAQKLAKLTCIIQRLHTKIIFQMNVDKIFLKRKRDYNHKTIRKEKLAGKRKSYLSSSKKDKTEWELRESCDKWGNKYEIMSSDRRSS